MTRVAGPSDKDLVLSLVPSRELRVRGTVADAETGRPIGTFTVVPGTEIGGPTLWHVEFAKVHHGGRFEMPFSHMGIQPHRVRIEARGYVPVTSPAYKSNAGEQVFDVGLRKGEWIEGVVRGPNGEPMAGAEVVLASGMGIHIDGGKTYQRGYRPHLVTGPDGRFSFPPHDEPVRIIAMHDRGYAEATPRELSEGHGLAIAPWGRIEGTLRAGGKPVPRGIVIASLDDEPVDLGGLQVQNDSRAQTDDEGRFVMERVVPGEARVHWQSQGQAPRSNRSRFYQPAFVDVLPGRTSRADLVQEGGRPVTGRVVRPGAAVQQLDRKKGESAYLLMKVPEVPYPPGLAEEDRRQWLGRWRRSEAGRTYRHRRRGFGATVEIQPDGSFRIDEVQAGEYELHVRVPDYAEFIRPFVVTDRGIGPVDLGTMSLEKSKPPDAGG
jgi:hypothetical protein